MSPPMASPQEGALLVEQFLLEGLARSGILQKHAASLT